MPTKKQENVLRIIAKHIELNLCSPTFAEIAASAGYSSVNSAVEVVAALSKKGVVARSGKGKMRNLIITSMGREVLGLPEAKTHSIMPGDIIYKYESLSLGMKEIVHDLVEELYEMTA
jgi:SOS-response transcriptional repressor LexA